MRVRISKGAQADLDDIFASIAADKPLAAARMLDRLFIAIDRLADFPALGRSTPKGRELTTVRPYIVLYVVRGYLVNVRRIVHGARLR